MATLPYGFDATFPYLNDDGLHDCTTEEEAWARLEEVQSYLANCRPLPPELAHWLGEAIRHSKKNRNEFVQRLGIARRTGERGRYSRRFKEFWKEKLWHLGTYNGSGRSVDQIVKVIQDEIPTRETLQDWFAEAMTGNQRIR